MTAKRHKKSRLFAGIKFLVWSFILLAFSAVDLGMVAYYAPYLTTLSDSEYMWTGVVVVLGLLLGYVGAVLFFVGVLRLENAIDGHKQQLGSQGIHELLRSINERLLISDTAKRTIYRENESQSIRQAIREDISKRNFDTALVLVSEMTKSYGFREEAEDFREEILQARAADLDRRVNQAITKLDQIVANNDWDQATIEAGRIQRLFPESPKVRDLPKRVTQAKEQHKRDLEREFLAAAKRDDVDVAVKLLEELDKYLTPAEAEPFRETARGVIGKKRDNLGVQFKLSIHDREWTQAVRVGEQIIREFPNSKMADEVRGMLDLLRERAAGEQAARA